MLVVSGLPTDENPGGRWWPDTGLGEGFRDPVALVDGTFEDGGFGYAVERASPDGWSFTNAAGGTFTGIEVTTRPVGPDDIAAAHASCPRRRPGTSPGSWSCSAARTPTTTRCAAACSGG